MKFCTPNTQTFAHPAHKHLHTQHTNSYSAQLATQMPKNKHVNILTWVTVNLIKLEFEIMLFCSVRVEKHVLIFPIEKLFKL